MTKVIKQDLAERLQPFLKDVECELVWRKESRWDSFWWDLRDNGFMTWDIKAPNLEEAIEFLPKEFINERGGYNLSIKYCNRDDFKYMVGYEKTGGTYHFRTPTWNTLLEAIEKLLEYLLDNDLLWTK